MSFAISAAGIYISETEFACFTNMVKLSFAMTAAGIYMAKLI